MKGDSAARRANPTKVPRPTDLSSMVLRSLKAAKKYHSGTISMGVVKELQSKRPRHGSAAPRAIEGAETPQITTGETSGFAIAIVPAAFSYFEHDTARTKLCSVDNQSRLEARSSGSLSFPCLGQRSSTRLLLDTGRRRSLHFVAVGHLALGFVGL